MYTKRAIVINLSLESGKRCSATFDRYGQNSSLFASASASGWSAERTVNQAVSEAIAGTMRQYPGDKIIDYRVYEID